jgi:hypothetical protein
VGDGILFNNLFTRIHMGEEWAAYSEQYIPLRVSNPKGNQTYTYRLQLSYKLSVPLILVSVILHWALSNILYLAFTVGGYFDGLIDHDYFDPSYIPFGAFLAVRYSSWALVALLVLSCSLICVPIAIGLFQLPANSITVESNSFAIAAS